jgi:hypothetical protein
MTGELHGERAGKNKTWTWRAWRVVAGYMRPVAILSIIAIVLSVVNLYATVWEQPILTAHAGCNWQYGRGVPGAGSQVEYFIVPVTVVNDGARTGTVPDMDLEIAREGSTKRYRANFIATRFIAAGVDDGNVQVFFPIAIAGHASASTSTVFVQPQRTERPWFGNGEVSFHATVKIKPAGLNSYRFIDRLFASHAVEHHYDAIAPVYEGKPVSFSVCRMDAPDLSRASAN